MAVDAAQIATDVAGIFTDLAATGASETATLSGGSTFTAIRGTARLSGDLGIAGLESDYEFSLWLIADGAPTLARGDTVALSDGTFRILRIADGPLTIYRRLDLGGQYESGP